MDELKKYTLKELKEKLTVKEKKFCHQYIIDWNGARAAREAGYSEKTAREIAHYNLSKLHIQQYIDYIKDDFEKESGISKLRQLNELIKIAYSSVSNLHETWIELKEFESLTEEQKSCIESIETKTEKRLEYNIESKERDKEIEIKYVKLKLHSKIQAIDQINKMMGYNAPNVLELTDKRKDISELFPTDDELNETED